MSPNNFENCKQCKNKYGCLTYLEYLENIADTSTIEPSIPEQPLINQDLFNTILSTLEEKMDVKLEGISNKIENISKTSNLESIEVSSIDENSIELGVPSLEPTDIPTTEIVVYDSSPLKKGDTYYEEKKTLFGGTKMVEKTVK